MLSYFLQVARNKMYGRSIVAGIRTGLLLCIIGAGLSCVYFNTFYNAQKAYSEARRAHEDALEEKGVADTAFTLPSGMESDYERTVKKTRKVLTVFSEQEQWHDDALFLMGKAKFYLKEYFEAIDILGQLRTDFPQSPYAKESFLYSIKANVRLGNYVDALELIETVRAQYPEFENDTRLSEIAAEIEIRRGSRSKALAILKSVYDSIQDPEHKAKLAVKLGKLYMALRKYAECVDLLEHAPRKPAATQLLFTLDTLVIHCHKRLDSYDAALQKMKLLLTRYQLEDYRANLHYMYGTILVDTDSIDAALQQFTTVEKQYPQSTVIGKTYMAMAGIYQQYKGDFDKALSYYKKAIEYCNDETRQNLAQRRVDAIKLLQTLRDTAREEKGDTTGWGEEMYRISELFWQDLGQPDSAFVHLRRVARDSMVSPDSLPKVLYAAGWIAVNELRDTSVAESLFTQLVSRYPSSGYSKQAQRILYDTTTIQTRLDSAREAFHEAERLLFSEKSVKPALRQYVKVYNTYPDGRYGPRSLYAAAWINDHILEKNVTARKLYEKLCEEYPQSKLCTSRVQPKLTAVEDTLRILRAKKRKSRKQEIPDTSTADSVGAP